MRIFFILLKKELKELLTPQFVLPLIAMVLVFASVGGLLQKETKKSAKPVPVVVVDEDRGEIAKRFVSRIGEQGFSVELMEGDVPSVLERARSINAASVIVIPEGTSDRVSRFQSLEIQTYTILSNMSMTATQRVTRLSGLHPALNALVRDEWFRQSKAPVGSELAEQPVAQIEHVVIGSRSARVGLTQVLAFVQKQTMFVPIILFLVIVIASQMVAVTVASEKENKTLETLLSTPVSRKSVIVAKITAAGIVAFVFAASYLYGLNSYTKGVTGGIGSETSIEPALRALGVEFGFVSYALVGVSLFLGIVIALSIAMMLGTLADSVKNVQAVTTPLMILILIPYFLTLMLDVHTLSPVLRYIVYAIPFSHSFLTIQNVVTHDYVAIMAGLAYQFVVLLVCVWLAARLFSSDALFTLRIGKRKQS